MASTTENSAGPKRLIWAGLDITTPAIVAAGVILSLIVWRLFGFRYGFPEAISSQVDFVGAIDAAETWLKDNVRTVTRAIGAWITGFIGTVEEFLWLKPWPLVVVAMALRGSGAVLVRLGRRKGRRKKRR